MSIEYPTQQQKVAVPEWGLLWTIIATPIAGAIFYARNFKLAKSNFNILVLWLLCLIPMAVGGIAYWNGIYVFGAVFSWVGSIFVWIIQRFKLESSRNNAQTVTVLVLFLAFAALTIVSHRFNILLSTHH